MKQAILYVGHGDRVKKRSKKPRPFWKDARRTSLRLYRKSAFGASGADN